MADLAFFKNAWLKYPSKQLVVLEHLMMKNFSRLSFDIDDLKSALIFFFLQIEWL